MAEAEARSSSRAPAETRVRVCGSDTIKMEKIGDMRHSPRFVRVHGIMMIYHVTRKIGGVRSKDEEPPCFGTFDHRMEVTDLSLLRSHTACHGLIHKMLAEGPVTGEFDLGADNWVDFQPQALATKIVANVCRDTEDPAYAIDVEMVFSVTLTYSEPKALLVACKEAAADETQVAVALQRGRKRRRRDTADEPCAICFLDVETQEEETVRLPCSHPFHSRCIEPWFHRASTCPTCRRDATKYFSVLSDRCQSRVPS
ncbi:unnamed protein product [Alopecurus aequalis]